VSIKYISISVFLLACELLFARNSFAAGSRCFLHGMLRPTGSNEEKVGLDNMIRMHFEADEKSKCERMLQAYCLYNVKNKQYSTSDLAGSYKADLNKDAETKYHFNPDCKVLSSDDND
jgi:hypothetical protein